MHEHMFVHPSESNRKGSIAELKIAAAAAALDIPVLQPMTEHGRYDLVFEIGGQLLRVQCKWARRKGDVVVINFCNYRITTNGPKRTKYRAGEIDALAAYCGEVDRVYLLPPDLVVGRSMIHLRLNAPRNGQRAALNWAADYELNGAIAQLGERRRGTPEAAGSSPASSISDAPSIVTTGAHQFRNHFGYYMERAAAGEEIRVSRRGKPYVRLLPAVSVQQAMAAQV
jgi:prevent-host-death family protein